MTRTADRRLTVALALLLAAMGGLWVLWERCGVRGCPDIDRLDGYIPDRVPLIVDRNGAELARLYLVRREIVPLDSLPEHVPEAFVAIEDQRFWDHDGIDWRRAFGAAWSNLRSLRIREGFSTITMQLARNAFPDRLPYAERTISRKFAEMRVARAIEERYSKHEILELYLNQIYFGGGAWGIAAAAHEYFRKPASALTLAEAALLAGMVTAPNGLNPRRQPTLAFQRRWVVLHVMWKQGMITAAEANAASAQPLITGESTLEPPDLAPYFIEEVRQFLDHEIGDALYTEGYTVHTTLDSHLQRVAEQELRNRLEAIEAGRFGPYEPPEPVGAKPGGAGGGPAAGARAGPGAGRARDAARAEGALQGAVVVLDARTGDVLAMVGGRDYARSRFNRAVRARRQPASTFKPIVYAVALENGYSPVDRLDDTPIHRNLGGGRTWAPRNHGNRYAAAISLRDALVLSSNVATIRLAESVGLDRVVEMAHRLGLDGPFPVVPALALGTAEVTLLELTAAYAAFATLGLRPEPRIIAWVEDPDGRIVWRREPRIDDVLDPGTAFLVTDILRDVVDRGTGLGVRIAGFRGPAAGKTGTTNDAVDYWYVGFTPDLVAGIWIGHDQPHPIVAGTPSEAVLPSLWGRIISRAGTGTPEPWAPPPSIEVRRVDDDGRIYAPDCRVSARTLRTEYFRAGFVGDASCHDAEPRTAGGIATDSATVPPADSVAVPAVDSVTVPAVDTSGTSR